MAPSPLPPPAAPRRDGIAGVIAGRGDRLGSRLRNLLEAWRVAIAEAAPLLWLWINTDDQTGAPYPLADLFDRAALSRLPGLTIVERDRRGRIATPPPSPWVEALASRADWLRADRDAPPPWPPGAIVRYRWAAPIFGDLPAPDIARLFAMLPIHPAVRTAADAATASLGPGYVALHLRRGDIVGTLASVPSTAAERGPAIDNFVSRYAPAGAYDRAVAAQSGQAGLAIFSDDTGARDALARSHDGRAVDPHATLDHATLTPLQRDFAELLTIARAVAVIGGDSHYCRTAARLGGARFVDVRAHVEPAEMIGDVRRIVGERDDGLLGDTIAALATLYRRLGHHAAAAAFAQAASIR